ncbi:hypothetical protein GQ44DRAFT_699674 [Phaeosphaeriaceae sp. PMI808]|nr:hypothetical protein GQ44DRAFT_699674 [Phaeosphaeriaceae sp. PMI808]
MQIARPLHFGIFYFILFSFRLAEVLPGCQARISIVCSSSTACILCEFTAQHGHYFQIHCSLFVCLFGMCPLMYWFS